MYSAAQLLPTQGKNQRVGKGIRTFAMRYNDSSISASSSVLKIVVILDMGPKEWGS